MKQAQQSQPDYDTALQSVIASARSLAQQLDTLTAAARASGRLAPEGYGIAQQLHTCVQGAFRKWRFINPALVGEDTPDARETALAEARRNVDMARQRLAWAQQVAQHPDVPQIHAKALVESWQYALRSAEDALHFRESGVWPVHEPTNEAIWSMPLATRDALLGVVRKPKPLPEMPK